MTMASDRDFIAFADDSVKEESVFESFGTDDGHTDAMFERKARPADYWLGQKYFHCIVAKAVACHVNEQDSIGVVDVSGRTGLHAHFQHALKVYPYQLALQVVQGEISAAYELNDGPTDRDDYFKLLTLVGVVVRRGSSSERQATHRIITDLCESDDSDDQEASSTGGSRRSVNTTRPVSSYGDASQTADDLDPNLFHYTMRLKEMGDREGPMPIWDTRRSPRDPSCYETIVKYRGYDFYGEAKKSQTSKHKASKAACNYFDGPQGR